MGMNVFLFLSSCFILGTITDEYVESSITTEKVRYDSNEAGVCPEGYVLKGTNGDSECPGFGLCCGAGWTSGCGIACAHDNCVKKGGTWIVANYDFRPYTCEMDCNSDDQCADQCAMTKKCAGEMNCSGG